MEVVGQVSGRRRWSDAEKLEILAEAFRPGVRVCDVIARCEVSSSPIYTWRKQLREGKLAGASLLLPAIAEVRVAKPAAAGSMFVGVHQRRDLLDEPVGNVWDNAAMESSFSSLMTERIGRKTYRTRNHAKADGFDYIERFYNLTRRYSTLSYLGVDETGSNSVQPPTPTSFGRY